MPGGKSDVLEVDEAVHRAAVVRINHDFGAAGAVRRESQRVVGDGVGSGVSGRLHQRTKVEEILAGMKIGDLAAGANGRKDEHVVAGAAGEDIGPGAGFDDVVAGAAVDLVVAGVARRDQVVELIADDVVRVVAHEGQVRDVWSERIASGLAQNGIDAGTWIFDNVVGAVIDDNGIIPEAANYRMIVSAAVDVVIAARSM